MPLHLQKLCVGADSIDDLRAWIEERRRTAIRAGRSFEQTHTTRMAPKRGAELVDGGSLYWIIRGTMQVRQTLLEVRPFVDGDGIARCHLVLDPELIPTEPRSRRPFQGWRYLAAADAPRDLASATLSDGLPPHMVYELRELGLL